MRPPPPWKLAGPPARRSRCWNNYAETIAIAPRVDTQCYRVRRSRRPGVSGYPIHDKRPEGGGATLGVQLIVAYARTDSDLETAFAAQQHVGAILVGISAFYTRRMEQLAALASRHALPARNRRAPAHYIGWASLSPEEQARTSLFLERETPALWLCSAPQYPHCSGRLEIAIRTRSPLRGSRGEAG
jgi:hypothetical protein